VTCSATIQRAIRAPLLLHRQDVRVRERDDARPLHKSALELVQAGTAPRDWAERVRLSVEATGWQHQGVSGRTLGRLLLVAGLQQIAEGDRHRAEVLWRQMEDLADRMNLLMTRRSEVIEWRRAFTTCRLWR
jgi:hypothetical protein